MSETSRSWPRAHLALSSAFVVAGTCAFAAVEILSKRNGLHFIEEAPLLSALGYGLAALLGWRTGPWPPVIVGSLTLALAAVSLMAPAPLAGGQANALAVVFGKTMLVVGAFSLLLAASRPLLPFRRAVMIGVVSFAAGEAAMLGRTGPSENAAILAGLVMLVLAAMMTKMRAESRSRPASNTAILLVVCAVPYLWISSYLLEAHLPHVMHPTFEEVLVLSRRIPLLIAATGIIIAMARPKTPLNPWCAGGLLVGAAVCVALILHRELNLAIPKAEVWGIAIASQAGLLVSPFVLASIGGLGNHYRIAGFVGLWFGLGRFIELLVEWLLASGVGDHTAFLFFGGGSAAFGAAVLLAVRFPQAREPQTHQ